jgi:hypothetical protein
VADEEERQMEHYWPPYHIPWDSYAKGQLERGDESLVTNFGIDIRILGIEPWDSDDSLTSMYSLWYELEADTTHFLGQWYEGENWSNYVDAIIGITAQATPEDQDSIAGLASDPIKVDQGRIFILLKWQVYWADDNLVQHEFSHLFYAPDHYYSCCAMAHHTHYQTFIWEDELWFVFADIPCVFTSYEWCQTCDDIINTYQSLYKNYPYMLVIRHGDLCHWKGSFSIEINGLIEPIDPGIIVFYEPMEVTIAVDSVAPGYEFHYWLVDGQEKVFSSSITINIDGKHTIAGYFKQIYSPPRGSGWGGGSRWCHPR